MEDEISLRRVLGSHVELFFEHHLDPVAAALAGVGAAPASRESFFQRWREILADDRVVARTIVWGGECVGYIARFEQSGKPSICYWLGHSHWGKGIATAAIRSFVASVTDRPLCARVVDHNSRSIRALQRAGFRIIGEDRVRQQDGSEIVESLLELG